LRGVGREVTLPAPMEWREFYLLETGGRFPGATRVWTARIYLGLSQEELAAAAGASRTTISSIERGRSTPSLALARSLARALDLTLDELFAGDELR
jgi:DNA-binding XRE family transcriptional regulator